jgi:hypothetical protein
VPKAEPINRPLCLMQYKVGGSFEDAITIGSDSEDDELNITPVVEEVLTTAVVEGTEKKVSPEEYLDIQFVHVAEIEFAAHCLCFRKSDFHRRSRPASSVKAFNCRVGGTAL